MISVRASKPGALAALIACALAVGAGCASLDGLSGGVDASDGGPARDASTPDAAKANLDGGADAIAALDGQVPLDAPSAGDAPMALVDAGADARDVDAGSWCSQQSPAPTLCDDFDSAPLGAWSVTNRLNGTLTKESNQVVSAPWAMQFATGATVAMGVAQASLDYVGPVPASPPSAAHLEWELRVVTLSGAAELKAGGFGVPTNNGSGPNAYDCFLIVTASGAYIEESAQVGTSHVYQDTTLPLATSFASFVHVELDLVLPTATVAVGSVTVRLNDVVMIDHQALFHGANGPVAMNAGLEVYPNVAIGPCELDEDNILLSVTP